MENTASLSQIRYVKRQKPNGIKNHPEILKIQTLDGTYGMDLGIRTYGNPIYCYENRSVGVYGGNSPTRRIMEDEGLFTNMKEKHVAQLTGFPARSADETPKSFLEGFRTPFIYPCSIGCYVTWKYQAHSSISSPNGGIEKMIAYLGITHIDLTPRSPNFVAKVRHQI
ncbi:hypothetical protein AVEN_151493-1 [Araneus ventricosus]|uniref:Uncharacterized protein n=1 Tax=Araneus ventricosus TaxID=182803 RepID=A0A4Y2HZI7_ARAVE|nr:hypothetical protein AVEN_151493-1 [Araneus ventricosus]